MATTSIENGVQKLSLEQGEAEKMTSKMDDQAATIKSLLALLGASDLKEAQANVTEAEANLNNMKAYIDEAERNRHGVEELVKECTALKKENEQWIAKLRKEELEHAELGDKHEDCDDKLFEMEQEVERLRKEILELKQKVKPGEEGDAEADGSGDRPERKPKRSRQGRRHEVE